MSGLRELVAAELGQAVDPRVADFAAALAAQYPDSARAVLFYGSCLRAGELDGLMLDFYLIVDDYRRAFGGGWLALANRLLPPNVFYLEHDGLRAKYAVLSEADFARLASARTFNVSVWARFAQPAALVWASDAAARAQAIDAVAGAAPALLAAARPLMDDSVPVAGLWTNAFAATYSAELRAEKTTRGVTIYDTDPARYAALTGPALAAAGIDAEISEGWARFAAPARANGWKWLLRRAQGKLLSALRLAKAAFTFDGGIEYLAWKIERHSGVPVPIGDWQRRHPLLTAVTLVPRLLRAGAIR